MTDQQLPWAARVYQWADARNLLQGSTPEAQMRKLCEEIGEYAGAVATRDLLEIRDALGDISVVLRIQAAQLGVDWVRIPIVTMRLNDSPLCYLLRAAADLANCLDKRRNCETAIGVMIDAIDRAAERAGLDVQDCREAAWDQIKHRTGRMIGGVFVKDA